MTNLFLIGVKVFMIIFSIIIIVIHNHYCIQSANIIYC